MATTYRADNVNAYTSLTGGLQFAPRYDDNGNLLNDAAHEYAYDMNNRLAAVDGSAITYKYDALGRRIAAGETLYYYVGDQMVESVIGGVTTSFVYGNNIDEALLMEHGNDRFFYHANHLGSTLALTDAFGEVWERVSYSPYGAPSFTDTVGNAIPASSAGNNILFTGREYDALTGTYYFRARTQHPALGRFMQKDPLMYINGLNDYAYTLNNPVIYSDPSGKVIPVIVGAVLIGANIGAWSTWYDGDKGTFSPLNTTTGQAAYEALKGGIVGGISSAGGTSWAVAGILVSGNFAAWESFYDEDCGGFSFDNASSMQVFSNAAIDMGTGFVGNKVGDMLPKNWQKALNDALAGFYRDYMMGISNQKFKGESIDWQGNANKAFVSGLFSGASSFMTNTWKDNAEKWSTEVDAFDVAQQIHRDMVRRNMESRWNPLTGAF